MHERDRGAGFAMGVMAGVFVGAGVALLLAPKAGTELRGELGQSVGSVRDGLARRLRDLADRVGAELDNLNASVERATQAANDAAASAAEMAGSAAERGRDRTDEWSQRRSSMS